MFSIFTGIFMLKISESPAVFQARFSHAHSEDICAMSKVLPILVFCAVSTPKAIRKPNAYGIRKSASTKSVERPSLSSIGTRNPDREAPRSVGSNGETVFRLKGERGVQGRRLDVQPSMSATLTPRILVLPAVPVPRLCRTPPGEVDRYGKPGGGDFTIVLSAKVAARVREAARLSGLKPKAWVVEALHNAADQ